MYMHYEIWIYKQSVLMNELSNINRLINTKTKPTGNITQK